MHGYFKRMLANQIPLQKFFIKEYFGVYLSLYSIVKLIFENHFVIAKRYRITNKIIIPM